MVRGRGRRSNCYPSRVSEEAAVPVLVELRNRYGGFQTYQDEGTREGSHHDSRGEHHYEYRFKTWFQRPDRFRFEWSEDDKPERFLVWDGRRSSLYLGPQRVCEEYDEFGYAVAATAGSGGGELARVGSLLGIPDIPGHFFDCLDGSATVGPGTVERRGRSPSGDWSVILRMDAQGMLREIDERGTRTDYREDLKTFLESVEKMPMGNLERKFVARHAADAEVRARSRACVHRWAMVRVDEPIADEVFRFTLPEGVVSRLVRRPQI
jgi:hypothetical protein